MTSNLLTPAQLFTPGPIMLVSVVVLIFAFVMALVFRQYRRCPSNRVLVVYGKVGGKQAARCVHGGGVFIIPLFQSYAYLSLEPKTIEIDLASALSKKNIRVNVPSTFTIGISTNPTIMNNAAERLLGLSEREISRQASDIILGQMRLVIATLTIEQINQDRETFLDLVNKYCGAELNKIGLDVINVNIRDISDESGYIAAIGRKAAAEAINQAKIEVAEANRHGDIGESTANRAREVEVAEQTAQSEIGKRQAERNQRIRTAQLEAEGVAGEADARRQQEIAIAEQEAQAIQGKKQAESKQRIRVASLEAEAVEGENRAKAQVVDYEATLAEAKAEAKRRGDVALANAARDVLLAEKEEEMARLEKTQIAQQMIQRKKVEIDAEAEAEKRRRIARGEADAVLAKYMAEAEGLQKVLEAKATGYERLLNVCGERKDMAPSLLLIEKLPELVAEQVKAIQNLRIDKITVWDSGQGNSTSVNGDGVHTGSTGQFLRGLIGALPPMHELAKQAGIDLPNVLGKVHEVDDTPTAGSRPGNVAANPRPQQQANAAATVKGDEKS